MAFIVYTTQHIILKSMAMMNTDFKTIENFKTGKVHDFIAAMTRKLQAVQDITSNPLSLSQKANLAINEEAQEVMEKISKEIVVERREAMKRGERPPFDDMLSLMVEAKDPQSGLGLSDDEIVAHILTFLIAGHETTSGLLSFAFYLIQTNPTVEAKAFGTRFLFN